MYFMFSVHTFLDTFYKYILLLIIYYNGIYTEKYVLYVLIYSYFARIHCTVTDELSKLTCIDDTEKEVTSFVVKERKAFVKDISSLLLLPIFISSYSNDFYPNVIQDDLMKTHLNIPI